MIREAVRYLTATCVAATVLALSGCSAKAPQAEGTARLVLSAAVLAPGVAEVLVTVGPGSGPAFAPFTVNLSKAQDTWTGFITGIPSGSQRSFDVVANDGSHNPLQAGSARADIVAGKAAMVVVNLGDSTPSPPFGNKAPVIDYVSASASETRPGGTVTLSISAHDPDVPPDTVSILWSAACGSFDDPTRSVVVWTAPATDGRCQITAKASDNRGASVSVFLAIDVATTTGDAMVEVTGGGNPSPVITRVVADVRYRSPVEGDLTVDASDPGGDPLSYVWASNCPSVAFGSPAAATSTFTNSDGTRSCVVTVTVSDGKGGQVVGDVTLPPGTAFNLAPRITHTVQPTVDLADPRRAQPVQPGDAVMLAVEAMDPESQNLTFTWTTNAGTLDGQADAPVPSGAHALHETTSPGKSVIVFHVGATMPADAKVTVTVRDPGNEPATHDFNFKPATATGPCAGKVDGTACDDGNPCTLTSSCQAQVCVGGSPVTCGAPAACKLAGVCQTSGANAGTCTYADAPTGTACDDARACTAPDTCAAGVCMSGASTCGAGQNCNQAGVCEPGACTPACSNRSCGPDGCGGTCGTCTTGTCNGATGQCVPPTGSTVVAMKIAKLIQLKRLDGIGSSGNSSFLSGTAVFSPAIEVDGASLSGAGGNDVYVSRYDMTTGAPVWRKVFGDDLDQFGKDSSAPTADGTVAVVGRVAAGSRLGECVAGPPVTCSGVVVSNTAAYESDFLMLVDAATGAMKTGTRVISSGIVGQISSVAVNPALNLIAVCGVANATSSLCQGTTAASCTPSTAFQGGNTDLLVALFDSAGTLKWARQVGGTPGVASDESCGAVAIDADGTVWAAGRYRHNLDLGGASSALPTLPNTSNVLHLWLGHFGADGATLAAQAYGTPANRCAGRPQTTCTPATAATDCAGATPATCTAAPVGNVVPYSLKVDSVGNLVVGGSFTASFPTGGLVSAGQADAFVAKFSSTLAPVWAVRLGNTQPDQTNVVAIAPGDNVIAVGSYAATIAGTSTTGAAVLTAPGGNTAGQAFILKLDAATGATHFAGGYGDAATQLATRLSVSGSRVHFGGALLGVIDFGAPTAPVDTGVISNSFTTFANIE
jgi:hypothetical protein